MFSDFVTPSGLWREIQPIRQFTTAAVPMPSLWPTELSYKASQPGISEFSHEIVSSQRNSHYERVNCKHAISG